MIDGSIKMINKLLFVDVETTSTDRLRSGVYQIAGIIEYEKVYEEFNLFCNIFDTDIVDEKSLKAAGRTSLMLNELPNPVDIFQKFIDLLSKHVDRYNRNDKFTAIGYFSEFDAEVLRSWFKKNKDNYFGSWFWHPFLDVSQLVAYVYQENRDLFKNFQLKTVAYMVEATEEKNEEVYHDALFDVRLTRTMYYKLNEMLLRI